MAAYFRSDFVEMANLLRNDRLAAKGSGQYLQALLYSAAEEHSPRADAAWKAVAGAQPSALLARLKSAESAIERGQTDAARPDVMSILAERPQSEAALRLAYALSRRNEVDAPALLSRLLESHPSCTRLAEAIKFYNAAAEQDKARRVEQQLASCAPESLQYARLLAESGRHSAAAAYLQQIVMTNPLHRAARRLSDGATAAGQSNQCSKTSGEATTRDRRKRAQLCPSGRKPRRRTGQQKRARRGICQRP